MGQPNDPPTDEMISEALVGSDTQIDWAIEQVAKNYHHYLACAIYRRYGRRLDEHDVTEAVDRTLQTLWELAVSKKYKPAATIKAFLVTIALRRAADVMRNKRPLVEEYEPQAASGETVWNSLCENEFIAGFNAFAASLKGNQKLVAEIIGRYLLQFHYPPTLDDLLTEMQRIGNLATTKESIKSSLREIRKKLRETELLKT